MRIADLTIPRGWDWPAFPFGVAATFAAGVLLLAGAVHICVILLVPALASADGWSRLAAVAADGRFAEIPQESSESGGLGLDPLFVNGACRLQLAEAPAGIVVDARDRFWSLALYEPSGTIVFSLNDRTAIDGRLDMIVVNPEQYARLQRTPTGEIDLTIVVESKSNDLVALLRLFAPTEIAEQEAKRLLTQAECLPAPSVLPDASSNG
jgi:uncharacterized membrane protein